MLRPVFRFLYQKQNARISLASTSYLVSHRLQPEPKHTLKISLTTATYFFGNKQSWPFHLCRFQNFLRRLSTYQAESPYELLGIARTATPKEIKMAYYREAKKWHPDMNPNNATAKERFQRITNAYELLMDDKRRSEFDRTGRTSSSTRTSSGSAGSQQAQQQNDASQQHAEDVFRSVQQDLEILFAAFRSYSADVQASCRTLHNVESFVRSFSATRFIDLRKDVDRGGGMTGGAGARRAPRG